MGSLPRTAPLTNRVSGAVKPPARPRLRHRNECGRVAVWPCWCSDDSGGSSRARRPGTHPYHHGFPLDRRGLLFGEDSDSYICTVDAARGADPRSGRLSRLGPRLGVVPDEGAVPLRMRSVIGDSSTPHPSFSATSLWGFGPRDARGEAAGAEGHPGSAGGETPLSWYEWRTPPCLWGAAGSASFLGHSLPRGVYPTEGSSHPSLALPARPDGMEAQDSSVADQDDAARGDGMLCSHDSDSATMCTNEPVSISTHASPCRQDS